MSTDLIETSKLTKSIIIPTSSKQQNHSNIEEMMMTTAAQIRDLKSGASAAAAALATSQNVTESVPVPSSEHVAEIVGRQGCKIKALRAKTNTYIKTPVRGEAPMFVITGRKEDVHTAKREIQLAADHFSQIRARRGGNGSSSGCSGQQLSPIGSNDLLPSSIKIDQSNNNASLLSSSSGSSSSSISVSPPTISNICLSSSSSSSCNHHHHNHHQQRSNSTSPNILIKPIIITSENNNELLTDDNASSIVHQLTSQQLQPGHIVKKVSVPYQVVGLVVGPKGSTIKRIQQNTNTYIVTPSRDSQPVFEIQGLPQHVEAAKIEIENYILLRTATTTPTPHLATNTTTTTTKSVSPQPLNNDDNFILNFASNTNKLEFEFYNNVIDIIDDLKLMSPNSSSLFKSVADVVNDEDSTFSNSSNSSTSSSSSSNNQQSNIWSSPQMNNDDQLFKHRSSISSSSSESSSTCNDVFSSNSSQTASLPLFINNNNNSFDFSTSIMSSFGTNNDNKSSIIGNVDPFLSSNSYATSLTSDTTNVAALNTLFQQHEHLLLNSTSSNNNSNDSFNYLTSVTNEFNFLSLNNHQQQQSQQQFY